MRYYSFRHIVLTECLCVRESNRSLLYSLTISTEKSQDGIKEATAFQSRRKMLYYSILSWIRSAKNKSMRW